jgi:carbonic anhydrase
MKRTVLEIVLALAMAGAAAFGYMSWKQAQGSKTEIEELTQASEEAKAKIEEAEKAAKTASEELEALSKEAEAAAAKASQLDAAKAGFSAGTTLADLEAAYKKEKNLSPERQIGLATLRMLTKGADDPATVEAYKKALAMADWGNRKNTICAAQIGLAATGEKVEIMADCLPKGSQMAKEGHGKDDAHAKDDGHGKKEAVAKADGHGGKEEPAKDPHAKDDGHASKDEPAKDGEKSAEKPADKHAAPHWDYVGDMGPARWGKEFPLCGKGKKQSPLDIKGPFVKQRVDLAPSYKPGPLTMLNNGHTIQVNIPAGSKLRIDGIAYDLLQFHFHRPSEEQIDGKPMAMVAHFVHKSAEGKLAVIGVLLKEGNENPNIKTLWANLPAGEGPPVDVPEVTFNPANLLPKELDFWSYEGSLTTPPCTEGVRFFILRTPVNISKEQVNAFPFKLNARPVQPQNNREIQIGQAPLDMLWLRDMLAQTAQAGLAMASAEAAEQL